MSSWHSTCQRPLPRLQLRLVFPRTWLRLHLVDSAIDLQWPSIVVCSHEACREFRITESAGSSAEFFGGLGGRNSKIHTHSLWRVVRSALCLPDLITALSLFLSLSQEIGVADWFRRRTCRGYALLFLIYFPFFFKRVYLPWWCPLSCCCGLRICCWGPWPWHEIVYVMCDVRGVFLYAFSDFILNSGDSLSSLSMWM